MQHFHDGKTCVESNEIRKLEGTHWYVCSILHDVVDALLVSDACFETDDCFVDVGHEDAIREEARGVCGGGRDFAHSLAEMDCCSEGLGRGLQAGDDFDAFLDRHGVHEVGGNDTR